MLTRLLLLLALLPGCAVTSAPVLDGSGDVPGPGRSVRRGTAPGQEEAMGGIARGFEGERGSRSGYGDVPDWGGPSSVASQLEEVDTPVTPAFRMDSIQRALEPYFSWKARLNEEQGLALGMDYTANYFTASEDNGGEDDAGSGNFRLFGSWVLSGRGSANTGSLVFKFESRHAYGDLPVSGLGFETGYSGLIGPPFNDTGASLSNFYWQQKFNEGRTTLVAGIVDSTDYLDIYGLINPWTHFSNLVFLTGSGAMPAPSQGIGAALGHYFSDRFYVVGGLADTNGDPTEIGDSIETAFDEAEYFTHVEFGMTSSYEERYLNNTHVTLWHAAERDEAGVADGWGGSFSTAHFYGERWLPFLRGGFAEDGGALLERSVSAGVGHYMPGTSDLVALAVNWGRPSQDDEQITSELFYRFQLSQNVALTPSLQYVDDPALNPGEDSIWYIGIRARLAL